MPAFHGGARHRYVIEYVSLLTTISHTATVCGLQYHTLPQEYVRVYIFGQCSAVQYVSMFTASRTCGGDYRHAAAKPPYTASTSSTALHWNHHADSSASMSRIQGIALEPPYSVASTLRSARHCTGNHCFTLPCFSFYFMAPSASLQCICSASV